MDITERQWFTHKGCKNLEIQKHESISEHEIVASVNITDTNLVESIMGRIEKLPPKGDMYKSFGDEVEHIDLIFNCEQGPQIIEIYNKMFKTPATTFNSSDNKEQKELYEKIIGYLK